MNIKVKYFTDVLPITQIDGEKSDWIDLRAAETVTAAKGDYFLIPLGVGMQLPKGYEAHIVPRSSTFSTYGIIQTNGIGIIDNSYCGNDDQWMMPVYATQNVVIKKNDRICQFRIMRKQPDLDFYDVEELQAESRGGFGSTGRN